MKYVALLRGINVGGNNKIKMSELKDAFEKNGFVDVATYINSGNVIFSSEEKSDLKLASETEKIILEKFNLKIPVVVRSDKEVSQILESIPPSWVNDKEMRTEVMFLWNEVDGEKVLDEIEKNLHVDNLIYTKGAIIWNLDRKNYKESKLHKFIGTKIYKLMTGRNVNTVRKLNELMN